MVLETHEVIDRLGMLPAGSGAFLELAVDLLDGDIAGDYDAGTLFRISEGFKAIAAHLESEAKAVMMQRLQGGRGDAAKEVVSGVQFRWMPGTESTAVNSSAVKSTFPVDDYPELYRTVNRRDYIKAS